MSCTFLLLCNLCIFVMPSMKSMILLKKHTWFFWGEAHISATWNDILKRWRKDNLIGIETAIPFLGGRVTLMRTFLMLFHVCYTILFPAPCSFLKVINNWEGSFYGKGINSSSLFSLYGGTMFSEARKVVVGMFWQ